MYISVHTRMYSVRVCEVRLGASSGLYTQEVDDSSKEGSDLINRGRGG